MLANLCPPRLPLVRYVCAQDNPMDDPDLQQLLKQAKEMQKTPFKESRIA